MNEQTQNIQQPDLINLLLQDGLENAIPRISELLMNAAMLLERIGHIGAAPNERNVDARNGYANGFKPRSFQTAMGKLQLAVPQVRESDAPFRTALLEQGSRSEWALTRSGGTRPPMSCWDLVGTVSKDNSKPAVSPMPFGGVQGSERMSMAAGMAKASSAEDSERAGTFLGSAVFSCQGPHCASAAEAEGSEFRGPEPGIPDHFEGSAFHARAG